MAWSSRFSRRKGSAPAPELVDKVEIEIRATEEEPSDAPIPEEHAIGKGKYFGKNTTRQRPPIPFSKIVWDTLKDPIILLLMAAATVSTTLGIVIEEEREHRGWIEGVAIWMAVLVVTLVGAGNDYQKDQQFRKLNEQREVVMVKVLRHEDHGALGHPDSPPRRSAELKPLLAHSSTKKRATTHMVVPNSEIVVGDVIILDTGDKVVADGIVISNNALAMDEASLNGETESVVADGIVISNNALAMDEASLNGETESVIEGSGTMLVLAVGENSEWGKTMSLMVEAGDEQTPLQKKLEDVASTVGKIGGAVAVACFVVMLVKWVIEHRGFPLSKINDDGPVQFFMFSVTIVVVAVPEGLPMTMCNIN
eukprot:gene7258-370_t